MPTTRSRAFALTAVSLLSVPFLTACGSAECKLDDPSTCDSSLICESVQGREKPLCVQPVEVRGIVFDLSSDSRAPVAGARVSVLDENGAPAASVVTTQANGSYVIRVPSVRSDEQGTPVGKKITLRAAAQDFVPFPSGIRASLPLSTSNASRGTESAPYLLQGAETDIGLAQLPPAEKGRPSISGTVEVDATQRGVLVIAEQSGGAGSGAFSSAVADAQGAFTLFNVAPASYTVRGYSRGVNYTPADVAVAAGTSVTDVRLLKSTTGTATLTGNVQTVAGGNPTSIVLAVRATFNATLARGEVIPGLRAPDSGIAPNVSGNFSIAGVPDGDYAVLAGFENDGSVRDPDNRIAGTDIQFISVRGGALVAAPEGFKVTAAVVLLSPGAGDMPEAVTSATPTFQWQAFPSTAAYTVELIDSLGQIIWTRPDLTGTQVTYDGPALKTGELYQWRAKAFRSTGGNLFLTSYTEDLRGVFRYAP